MKFKKWLVIQKVILLRGYQWANTPMIGVIFVSAVKMAFPQFINTTWKFILFACLGFVGLYILGFLDKKLRLIHEEQNYMVEVTPEVFNHIKESKGK